MHTFLLLFLIVKGSYENILKLSHHSHHNTHFQHHPIKLNRLALWKCKELNLNSKKHFVCEETVHYELTSIVATTLWVEHNIMWLGLCTLPNNINASWFPMFIFPITFHSHFGSHLNWLSLGGASQCFQCLVLVHPDVTDFTSAMLQVLSSVGISQCLQIFVHYSISIHTFHTGGTSQCLLFGTSFPRYNRFHIGKIPSVVQWKAFLNAFRFLFAVAFLFGWLLGGTPWCFWCSVLVCSDAIEFTLAMISVVLLCIEENSLGLDVSCLLSV